MRSCSFLFLLTLLIGLAGCVPEHQKEMASLADTPPLASSLQDALQRPDFELGNWPSANWWELFEDPQLSHLIEIALRDSPTLKKAQARMEEAKQLAQIQRARLFPHLKMQYLEQWQYFSKNGFVESFYPTTPGITIPPTANQIDLTLNFDYELDFWGKNRKRYQAALGQARSIQAEAAQATLMLLTSIAETYFQLQALLAQQTILQEKLEEQEELFELSGERNIAGLDAHIPVLKTEQDLYRVEQTKIIVEREIELHQHLLKVLIGQGPNASDLQLPLTASFNKAFALPDHVTADLLARRPDLQAQIWLVESAAKEIGAAKADFYPNVSLSAFGGLESLQFNKLFKISSKMGGLEPALTLPIFTGGRLTAHLRSKVAAFNEAVFAYNELILKAAQDVADKLITLQTKQDELAIQLASLEAVDEEYQLELSSYQQGIRDYLSVLTTKEQMLDQRFLTVTSQRDKLLAVLQLIKALGGGYRTPFKEANPNGR